MSRHWKPPVRQDNTPFPPQVLRADIPGRTLTRENLAAQNLRMAERYARLHATRPHVRWLARARAELTQARKTMKGY